MAARKHTAKRVLADWDRLRVVLALQRGRTLSAGGRTLGVDHRTVARRWRPPTSHTTKLVVRSRSLVLGSGRGWLRSLERP